MTTVARALGLPRLSTSAGFWAIAFAFFVITAFSTAPSSLYGIYVQSRGVSALAVTVAYAVYAVGLLMSLLLAGHVSDWYGRRAVLLPAFAVAIVAAVLLLLWVSLAGLLVARVLTGLAVGGAVATATAYLADLADGRPRRAAVTATVANIGGLGAGPLIAGLLAGAGARPLTLPFTVFLVGLVVAGVLVLASPDGEPATHPRPRYHVQRLRLPTQARSQFVAAVSGAFLCFAVFGLFAGLAGRFLAELGHPAPALCGLTIFLTFGTGVVVQTTTMHWAPHRLIGAGIVPMLVGVGALVVSAWASPPSLVLFVAGGIIAGAGGGAIFRGSLTLVISTARPHQRAGALATFFTAGYVGVSVPVLGLGVALEHLSWRASLLLFGVAVAAGVLAAAPLLVRRPTITR